MRHWLYELLHRRAVRRGRMLDHAHQEPGGDRLPIGDDERVRMLVHKEWL